MSLYIVINFLLFLLTYKFSGFFSNRWLLLIKKRKIGQIIIVID